MRHAYSGTEGNEWVSTGARSHDSVGDVPPKDPADVDWTASDELSGRRAFDAWRFAELERFVPWDWADMGSLEKRQWIDRAKEERAASGVATLARGESVAGRRSALVPRIF